MKIIHISILPIALIMIFIECSNKSTNSSGPPAAPSGLIGAALSTHSAQLAWFDNSNNETGFIVNRTLSGALDNADTTAANTTLLTEDGLYDSTAYSYYVVAINGQESSASSNVITITTFHSNSTPVMPSYPFPHDSTINVPVNVHTEWRCGDPHGDSIVYDIYFDTLNPPHWAAHQDSLQYYPSSLLLDSTTYFWRVVATDSAQNRIASPIWRFRTG